MEPAAPRPDPDPSDEDLVARANRGDPRALEALYRRYRDWIVALAHRTCGNRDDALEVLQETFVYLCRKLPRLALRARMKTFLYPVVRHLALDRIRRRRRTVPLAEEPAVDPPRDPAAERRAVEEIALALPEGQREVVLLRFGDGLALEEIAAALGIPLGTVKSRLHHALARLREALGPEFSAGA
jgi:RNA polymerase sigma-70 factor (ECF subfamily)